MMSFAAAVLAKVTITMALALGGARLGRNSRAAVRHVLLASAFAVILVLPLASIVAPSVRVEVPMAAQVGLVPVPPETVPEVTTANAQADAGAVITPASARSRWPSLPALVIVLGASWIAGAAMFVLPVVAGLWQIRAIRRSGLPWRHGRPAAGPLAIDAGIRRPVVLLLHESMAGPMTCGTRRPAIVLPMDAQTWPEEDLRRAIVHELEHVRRGDWATQCAARIVCAVYWFCPASQNDVSVYKNLLFMSSEATNSRTDCGFGGVPDPISKDRVRGIRVFDISDVKHPKLVTSVQTCRGSHTHTVVTQPGDTDNVYIYVSGTSRVRSAEEVPGCADGGIDDPNTARFRLEVIKVPLAAPATAAIVSSPRIFNALPVPPRNPERDAAGRANTPPNPAGAAGAAGDAGRGRGNQGPPTGPNQCHDITVYPEIGLAGGACAGLGLLLDIRDVANPKRLDFVADVNMSFWHSATFSNDGRKLLFSDEWGGGSAPRCRDTDKLEWGSDALFTIEDNKLKFHSYYKLPAPQTSQENCVAHNGSLVPIPGRDVMVQAWYQGGLSVFDWTDADHPKEIAFFDRGPISAERLVSGGSWSAYWYNGLIVSSEIARGLDVYELLPSPLVSANEIAAAKTVKMTHWNTQNQQKIVWPPSFALARAYLDQLERANGLAPTTIAAARTALTTAERRSGAQRKTALTELASKLDAGAAAARDQAKVRMLSTAVTDLANAQR